MKHGSSNPITAFAVAEIVLPFPLIARPESGRRLDSSLVASLIAVEPASTDGAATG